MAGVVLKSEYAAEVSAAAIAHYKIARYVHITDEFPLTVTGKVQKDGMKIGRTI